ncbi:MAG: ATP phosphoribosyltransferase [Anaerolineae bacterium]|mgnify:CR=1 FL=1|nr:ATP phosphoribosyltransferase [Anaerolineae bacterium]
MLSVVLPKGSLEQSIMALFQQADLTVLRDSDREYRGTIDDPRIGEVRVLRPQEIPTYVARGYFDIGVSGLDWVRETESDVVEVLDLGRTVSLVLAVAESSHVNSARDIPPGSRISTEYPVVTRKFFQELGIPVEIYLSYGATEAKIPDIADAVVELTETGSTLRQNRLKIIDTIMRSSSRLIMNPESYQDEDKRCAVEDIRTLIEGALAARGRVLVKLNVSQKDLEAVINVLPSMKAPTVSSLFGNGYYAVETVVQKNQINRLIPQLKRLGAEDILEIPIGKIVE